MRSSPVRSQKIQLRIADNTLPYNIGHCVFSGCKKLAAVTLPHSLTDMHDKAFDDHVRLGPSTHPFARGGEGESDSEGDKNDGEGESDNNNAVMVGPPTKAAAHHDKDVSENNHTVSAAHPSTAATEPKQTAEVATESNQQVENATRAIVATVLTPPTTIMQVKDTHSLGKKGPDNSVRENHDDDTAYADVTAAVTVADEVDRAADQTQKSSAVTMNRTKIHPEGSVQSKPKSEPKSKSCCILM